MALADVNPDMRRKAKEELDRMVAAQIFHAEHNGAGYSAFEHTALQQILISRGIDTLIVTGITSEVCVSSTLRSAIDRGYRCIVPGDCCGSYFPEFHAIGLKMIKAQGGIFGWVTDASRILAALSAPADSRPRPERTVSP